MEYSSRIERNKYSMLGLKETIDQLAMANSIPLYCHVLRREDGHVSRRASDLIGGKRKKGRPKRTQKKQVEEKNVKVGLRREDVKWIVGVNLIATRLGVNLITLTWQNYRILNMNLYLSNISLHNNYIYIYNISFIFHITAMFILRKKSAI